MLRPSDLAAPTNSLLEGGEGNLKRENKEAFSRFVRCMLQWDPENIRELPEDNRRNNKLLPGHKYVLKPTNESMKSRTNPQTLAPNSSLSKKRSTSQAFPPNFASWSTSIYSSKTSNQQLENTHVTYTICEALGRSSSSKEHRKGSLRIPPSPSTTSSSTNSRATCL